MPTWSNAGSLPPGSLPRNLSAKSSAIAIFGPSPSFLEENENPTPTPRRWRNMKLSRSQPSTKLGTPSYTAERLENPVLSYLANERTGQTRRRTVREFCSEFCGLTGSLKPKQVIAKVGLERAYLDSLLDSNDRLNRK